MVRVLDLRWQWVGDYRSQRNSSAKFSRSPLHPQRPCSVFLYKVINFFANALNCTESHLDNCFKIFSHEDCDALHIDKKTKAPAQMLFSQNQPFQDIVYMLVSQRSSLTHQRSLPPCYKSHHSLRVGKRDTADLGDKCFCEWC